MSASRIRLTRPDDWHVHFRDGAALAAVAPATAEAFGRAIVMPNLKPPITTTEMAARYRARIASALPRESRFAPLMTLYLTDETSSEEIVRAKASGFVHAVKYYPAGATTNSQSGVTALSQAYPALAAMERADLVLAVHGEVTDPDVDVFDRERVFVERELATIVRDFPALRVVLEHVTTREGVEFVASASARVAATITPQHLLYSRNALFAGGL
ncbi:MAG TPA: amidohydrolase family protein, partial [Casimicrobiaceae bacterium]|nr:amidohydrolase family protein [Casimicrobiaceae bacterium]